MRIVITGGHMSPSLAVIEELSEDTKILMIGRRHGIEGDKALSLEYLTAKMLDIPFKAITTGRWQRKFTKHTITSLVKFPYGIFQAISILKKFKPDIILTFGGYIALPVAMAGLFLRIPVVVHEQTLEAGLSNRIIAIFAKKVFISWESSRKFFHKNKTVLTGNPIRKFSRPKDDRPLAENIKYQIPKEDLPLIYITGGSSGSHAINMLIEGCISKLLERHIVIHQTGDAREYTDFERLEKLKASLPEKLQKRYVLTKFVKPDEVFSVLKSSSLVISRSGINTVTELIYAGKPAVLIPLPFSQNQEQLKNAMFFKTLGLGEALEQNKASSQKLIEIVDVMIKNLTKYKESAKAAQKGLFFDSSKKIVELLKEIK